MSYLKTKQLADQFGFCKRTIVKVLHEMESLPEYQRSVIRPAKQGGSYRADPDAVFRFLKIKSEINLKEACGI